MNGHENSDTDSLGCTNVEHKIDDTGRASSCTEACVNYTDGPIVTNTSLNVLRLIGKYMQIMYALNSISYDVLLSIFHLFDYYLYTVYIFFCKEISELQSDCLSSKLRYCLQRIDQDSLCHGEMPCPMSAIHSSFLDSYIAESENLYGLMNRIVGIESM